MDNKLFNESIDSYPIDGDNNSALNDAINKLIVDHQDPDTVAAIVQNAVPNGQFARYRNGILSLIDENTGEPVSRYKITATVTPI